MAKAKTPKQIAVKVKGLKNKISKLEKSGKTAAKKGGNKKKSKNERCHNNLQVKN